jgi:excisionase family DNA binding protein
MSFPSVPPLSSNQPHFSPKQVAASLDVSESSIKRWCDRGTIPTIKTSGGHRRISLDGLHDFLQATERDIVNPDALGFTLVPGRRQTKVPGSRHPTQAAFREALSRGDEQKCSQLKDEWRADGWSLSETADDLITDALYGIGMAWQCSELDIYQERVACGICLRLINEMKRELPAPSKSAPVAIGGTLSGDLYEVPSALVDLTLAERGWRSTNLGVNLPFQSFVQATADHSPALVWLSVSVVKDEDEFVSIQNLLANSLSDDVSLIVGGQALNDKIRPKLRYTAHCDSIGHLASLASMIIKNRYGGS